MCRQPAWHTARQPTLRDKNGSTRSTVRYNDRDPWPVAPDGGGHSLILTNTNRAVDDYRVWGVSKNRGGTPGSGEPTAAEEPYANPEVDLSVGIPYINYDHSWKYEDSGGNLGTTWKEVVYNDAGWSSGPGSYGFEDGAIVPSPTIQTDFEDPVSHQGEAAGGDVQRFAESSLSVSTPAVIYLTKADGTTISSGIDTAMPLDGRSVGRKPEGSGSWFALQ